LHRAGGGRWAAAHPWPRPLPASWSVRWGAPEPLQYIQVDVDAVAEIEIEIDAAAEDGRWRTPPKLLRIRTDMSVYDVPLADPPP
jgi:hypothetical protein